MTEQDERLRLTCRALAFVLDVNPDQLRSDTPLAGVGADSVAVIAWADLLEGDLSARGAGRLDAELVRRAVTVGQLAEAVVSTNARVG